MLAIFRSCARKEYRDQVVKMLRGMDGEATRTTYRMNWVTPEAVAELEAGQREAVGIVVDPSGSHAVPVRLMSVDTFTIDRVAQILDVTFILGQFVDFPADASSEVASWGGRPDGPPEHFVTRYAADWPPLPAASSWREPWRRCVDFVSANWDLTRTVFFRPISYECRRGEALVGDVSAEFSVGRGGPAIVSRQLERIAVKVVSYNPHIDSEALSQRSFRVAVSELSHKVSVPPPIPRDGEAVLEILFLGAGEARMDVETFPDPQFSTYVPFSVGVQSDPNLPSAGVIIAGSAWRDLLAEVSTHFAEDAAGEETMLRLLREKLGQDAALLRRLGELAYSRGDLVTAHGLFLEAHELRRDAWTAVWLVATTLASDGYSVTDAISWLEQVDLSDRHVVATLVDRLMSVPWPALIAFVALVPAALADGSVTPLLEGILHRADSEDREDAAVAVVNVLSDDQADLALRHARELVRHHIDWSELRMWVVRQSVRRGEVALVEEDIELLLVWQDGDPAEMLTTAMNYAHLIDPARAVPLILESARKVTVSGDEGVHIGLTLALTAAKLAVSSGQFTLAQEALQLVHVNVDPEDPATRAYWNEMEQILGPMLDAARDLHDLDEDCDFGDLTIIIRDILREREQPLRLQVVGGSPIEVAAVRSVVANIEDECAELVELGVYRVTDTAPVDVDLVVVPWSVDTSRGDIELDPSRSYRILPGRASVLWALRLHLATAGEAIPESVADAVRWGVDLEGVTILESVMEGADELDRHPRRALYARRTVEALTALGDYAMLRRRGALRTSFFDWAPNAGIPRSRISGESESVGNDARLRKARSFRLPVSLGGQTEYMEWHFKFGNAPPAPRLHFLDLTNEHGVMVVGYLGPHLDNLRTN